jgi:hypothetical protein
VQLKCGASGAHAGVHAVERTLPHDCTEELVLRPDDRLALDVGAWLCDAVGIAEHIQVRSGRSAVRPGASRARMDRLVLKLLVAQRTAVSDCRGRPPPPPPAMLCDAWHVSCHVTSMLHGAMVCCHGLGARRVADE